ncbi:MAG: substrate-binding domain-containing protein [Anaerolineales bacterium]|nr:substrate-binding domain-containing protein [Anaerolineales bacterium]
MADPTLEDIAKLVGVSRSTVSRVVNNHPNVSDDVRKRVLEAIRSTGYHPNIAARTLASQRSGMVALVLPHEVTSIFIDPYFPHLIQGIAQACNQYDYSLGLFLVGSKEDEEKIIPRVSSTGMFDGVIVQSGHQWNPIIGRLIASKIPLVVAGRPSQPMNVSYIDVDNVNAAYNAVSHLIRLGYRRIGTITGPTESAAGIDRIEGYSRALAERRRGSDPSLIVEGDFTEAGGYYAMRELLSSKPDAIFAASDIMAIGAMRAVREAGFSVPDDIAFVGFDDIPQQSSPNPTLTTIRQPITQFSTAIVEILLDLIENGINPPRRIILDTELIIRESCGASHRGLDNRV